MLLPARHIVACLPCCSLPAMLLLACHAAPCLPCRSLPTMLLLACQAHACLSCPPCCCPPGCRMPFACHASAWLPCCCLPAKLACLSCLPCCCRPASPASPSHAPLLLLRMPRGRLLAAVRDQRAALWTPDRLGACTCSTCGVRAARGAWSAHGAGAAAGAGDPLWTRHMSRAVCAAREAWTRGGTTHRERHRSPHQLGPPASATHVTILCALSLPERALQRHGGVGAGAAGGLRTRCLRLLYSPHAHNEADAGAPISCKVPVWRQPESEQATCLTGPAASSCRGPDLRDPDSRLKPDRHRHPPVPPQRRGRLARSFLLTQRWT